MSQALATTRDRHTFVANELEKARDRLAGVIPIATGLTPTRAIAVVLDALTRTPDLLRCHPPSIVRSVLHAAEVGLELGSPLGEAYLVPFSNKGRLEASMIPGYRGLVKLVRGSPRVSVVEAHLVRAGDTFTCRLGTTPMLDHIPGAGDIRQRGEVTHAYALVRYSDTTFQFEVMDRVQLDKIQAGARSKGGPWRDHTDEMQRKCPMRRLAKWLDLSPLARRCVEIDDLEAMRRGEIGALREGFASGRAEDLEAMLRARSEPVAPIEIEGELIDD